MTDPREGLQERVVEIIVGKKLDTVIGLPVGAMLSPKDVREAAKKIHAIYAPHLRAPLADADRAAAWAYLRGSDIDSDPDDPESTVEAELYFRGRDILAGLVRSGGAAPSLTDEEREAGRMLAAAIREQSDRGRLYLPGLKQWHQLVDLANRVLFETEGGEG